MVLDSMLQKGPVMTGPALIGGNTNGRPDAGGQRIVEETARRYSMSTDAVRAILETLVASGGMIMIGDMFNSGLKSRIGCAELSDLIGRTDIISYRPQSSQRQSQGSSGSIPLPDSSFFVRGHESTWKDFGAAKW